jgi:uncharacterized protein (DUF433 family)
MSVELVVELLAAGRNHAQNLTGYPHLEALRKVGWAVF